jgi:hypothetical protein
MIDGPKTGYGIEMLEARPSSKAAASMILLSAFTDQLR